MNPTDLSIIVPTYNERDNIGELSNRIAKELPSVNWELIFVDDNSPDGTAIIAQQLGRIDPRVRCIRRVGRRGLASACIEGMLSSNARFFIVMDADLQHDPCLPARNIQSPTFECGRPGDREPLHGRRHCQRLG